MTPIALYFIFNSKNKKIPFFQAWSYYFGHDCTTAQAHGLRCYGPCTIGVARGGGSAPPIEMPPIIEM